MAIPAVLAAVGRTAATTGRVVAAGGEVSMGKKLISAAGDIGQVAFAAQSLSSSMTGLASVMIPFSAHTQIAAGALKTFVGAVSSVGNAVAGFVKLASPVHVQMFNLAVDDLVASIGKALVPVMEYGTKIVRLFADVVFQMSGPLSRILHAVLKPMMAALDLLLTAMTPQIHVFVAMADALALLLEVSTAFSTGMMKLANNFLSFGGSIKDKSVGAAVRPAQFSSPEEYGRRAQQAAFSLGGAADSQTRTANAAEELVRLFRNFPTEITKALLATIGGGLTGMATSVVGSKGFIKRADTLHSDAVDAFENTLGIELPSFRR